MKPPFAYYGGKQMLLPYILPIIPPHKMYTEPFCGGAAVFFAKKGAEVEVINDTNKELINFYEVMKTQFVELEKKVIISLHSRSLFQDASVIYQNPHLFTPIQRAWAVYVLACQGYSGQINPYSWGYDIRGGKTSKHIHNKRNAFTEEFAIRLQTVQVECTDAIRIVKTRDYEEAFHYCDPPYYNSNMGHYDGYTIEDFELLLTTLSKVKGKFLLSSYPSDMLKEYILQHKWHHLQIEQRVAISKKGKRKIECLTANYPIQNIMDKQKTLGVSDFIE